MKAIYFINIPEYNKNNRCKKPHWLFFSVEILISIALFTETFYRHCDALLGWWGPLTAQRKDLLCVPRWAPTPDIPLLSPAPSVSFCPTALSSSRFASLRWCVPKACPATSNKQTWAAQHAGWPYAHSNIVFQPHRSSRNSCKWTHFTEQGPKTTSSN